MEEHMATAESERVVVGMDPHKRSVTIEVMDADEAVLGGGGRFGTDVAGTRSMLDYLKRGRTGSGQSRAAVASDATSHSG